MLKVLSIPSPSRRSRLGRCLAWLAAAVPHRWLALGLIGAVGLVGSRAVAAEPRPLTTVEYRLAGSTLTVSPVALSVPKGLAGSVAVQFTGDPALTVGAYVSAILRGPSFPAREILGAVNAPLLLPPLSLVGDYQLDQIRLVRVEGGQEVTVLEAVPGSIPVRVFDEVLVSKVTSRPLTTDEIREKGIVIDEQNFRAVEFEVGLVLDGKTVPVRLPVVAPRFTQRTEIIPAAELEERLRQAEEINRGLDLSAQLPPELRTSQVNLEVQPINFQFTEEGESGLGLGIPPIPALLFIPGNIGFLNQFFSVQLFTENAAPNTSGLSVVNVSAELVLPPGPDQVRSTVFAQPGDDPLRAARVGAAAEPLKVRPVVRPGADGKLGTADDVPRLQPGESGQAEFLVEGLQEGLHVLEVNLTADLDGLAAGRVKIQGRAAGAVLVRNPKFSLAFTHPRTVRNQEFYEASVSILNTGLVPANEVRITLPLAAISGAELVSDQTVELGTLLPGQTGTARYRLRAQRTGSISFSNLTTGGDVTAGRFRLSMGVDERGVTLSPDSLGFPEDVARLPEALRQAADRVLGQALSVATAPLLPTGVKPVNRGLVKDRVIELAEAGQRLRFGDTLQRVLADLLLDWQGGRKFHEGWDQILRETDAGREWREALAAALRAADGQLATERLESLAPRLAGRGEAGRYLADDFAGVAPVLTVGGQTVSVERSEVVRSLGYGAVGGHWLALAAGTGGETAWRFPAGLATGRIVLVDLGADGRGRQLAWTLSGVPPDAVARLDLGIEPPVLRLEVAGSLAELVAAGTPVVELAPEILGAVQDLTVLAGRPSKPCPPFPGANYGTVVGVLFSKPMTQATVDRPGQYRLDNGIAANSVQIQPGGRVALLNLTEGISAIRPRSLTATGILDVRGNAVTETAVEIRSEFGGKPMKIGVVVRGRVLRADGSVAAGVPVTLTMHDEQSTGFDCAPVPVRVSQQFADANGQFDFDFVPSGIAFTVSATDTSSLSPEALQAILSVIGTDAEVRERLQELATANPDTLLEAFAVGGLPQAIAKAEGLDRAALRDSVGLGSAREGTDVVVGLRFRGRGTVTGTVVAADGRTPVPGAAVNLFPDPTSRELGRGVFADTAGGFAFFGVPLGVFSVTADTGSGLTRQVSSALTVPGQVQVLTVELSEGTVSRTELGGRVTEADGVTPHNGAQVYVGRLGQGDRLLDVVAVRTADAEGLWTAANIPVGDYDVVALSADGTRRGTRRAIQARAGVVNQVAVALQGFARVVGFVETPSGRRVKGALVAGLRQLVTTDALGFFELTDVPTGQQTIHAGAPATREGAEPKTDPVFRFSRLGSANLTVLPGQDNFVVVRFPPAGAVVGRVVDEDERPVPNIRVALPQDNGFAWVLADSSGFFRFENLAPGPYTFSAPSGPVEETDFDALQDTLRDPGAGQEAVEAAIGAAFAAFTGASNPLLNGAGAAFDPASWGYTQVVLPADNAVVEARIQFFRRGTVSGVVVNGQGTPIGAKVRLVGLGAAANGSPSLKIRGELNSDAADGTFRFPDAVFFGTIQSDLPPLVVPGVYGLQSANPLIGSQIITDGGVLTFFQPTRTNHVLRFPSTLDVNGSLTVTVLNPDGTPAGEGVKVGFEGQTFRDLVLSTDAAGVVATSASPLPAGSYTLTGTNLSNGVRGQAVATVVGGERRTATLRLLGPGRVRVRVLAADGSPTANAEVVATGGAFPRESARGTTDATGTVEFGNLPEGPYALAADFVTGPTRIQARGGVGVERDTTVEAVLVLQPTGTISGRFVKSDQTTPVANAQVSIGGLAFVATDDAGAFRVAGLPLGTYRVTSSDPVTGRGAIVVTSLVLNGEEREVRLVEQTLAELSGTVLNSFRNGVVAGAVITLQVSDGLSVPRTVTTGPDGRFSFAGVPAGAFRLDAKDPVNDLGGQASGVLADGVTSATVDISLEGLGTLAGTVLNPDGTPAVAARVVVELPGRLRGADTDAQGRVEFSGVPLSEFVATARSSELATSHSVGQVRGRLETAGGRVTFEITLRGVGEVVGTVFDSDGVTPVVAAEVSLQAGQVLLPDPVVTTVTDAQGQYRFRNVAVGSHRVGVVRGGLAASGTADVETSGASVRVDLVLAPSATVIGRIVRADGVTPVAAQDVLLRFGNRGGTTDRAFEQTVGDGTFRFENIPLGDVVLEARSLNFSGLILQSFRLEGNGSVRDLGTLIFDEAEPRVAGVFPGPDAVGIPVTTAVELRFSEELDPATINGGALLLREGGVNVPVTVTLLPLATGEPGRLIRLVPVTRLKSVTRYEVLALPLLVDGVGTVIGSGPKDRVGRSLAAPFTSSFATADNDAPQLVSLFPAPGAVQVDPRTVARASFNEPVRDSAVAELTGPTGPVPGTSTVVLGGLAVTFTPLEALTPNTRYTFAVRSVVDLAGNPAASPVFASNFDTLDTRGPEIGALRLVGNVRPVAGRTVEVEAVLAVAETGARVRFNTGDAFTPAGEARSAPFRTTVRLPETGSLTVRAIASDRFNNDGPVVSLVIPTVADEAPVPTLRLVEAEVIRGEPFTVEVAATDDLAVTALRVTAPELLNLTTNVVPTATTRITLRIPNSAPATGTVRITAVATDAKGQQGTTELAITWRKVNQAPTAVALVTTLAVDRVLVRLGGTDPDEDRLTAEVRSLPTGARLFQTADGATPGEEITAPGTRVTDGEGRVLLQAKRLFKGTVQFDFTVSDGALASASAAASAVLRDAAWVPLTGLFNTGVDAAGVGLPDGAADPHYRLTVNADGPVGAALVHSSTIFPVASGPWLANSAESKWIGPRVDTGSAATGIYEFTLGLALDEVIGETAEIEGQWATDNAGIEIRVNGVAAPVTSLSFSSYRPFVLTEGFVSGANTLVFRLNNGGGPTGLRVDALRGLALRRADFAGHDEDGDLLDDAVELANGLDPQNPADAGEDLDRDGVLNREELAAGTRVDRADTDGDGLNDREERDLGTVATNPDTDGDGIRDGLDRFPLAANQAPVAGPDELQTRIDTAVTFTLGALLNNDVDPEGEGLEFLSLLPAERGTVTTELGGSGRYTPATGVSGDDTFGYLVRDRHGLISTGLVVVKISANRPPVADATGADFTVKSGEVVIVDLPAIDPNGDRLTRRILSLPDHGRLFQVADFVAPLAALRRLARPAINGGDDGLVIVGDEITTTPILVTDPKGRVAYRPAPLYVGPDQFSYLAFDGELESAPAVRRGTVTANPAADTDGDGIPDAVDPDPLVPTADLDGDGIADVDDPDVDGDQLSNEDEARLGTNPRRPDSDGDRWVDGLEVNLGSDPTLASSTPLLFIVGAPQPGHDVVLPAAPTTDVLTGGITVAEPAVEVVLPVAPTGDLLVGGITVGQPPVDVVLPAAPTADLLTGGITVGEPAVDVVLPVAPTVDLLTGGITVGEPAVDVVLPAAPTGDLLTGGIIVSQPTVIVDWEPAPGGGGGLGGLPGGSTQDGGGDAQPGNALQLLRLRVDPADTQRSAALLAGASAEGEESWWVTLEWRGPAAGRFVIESSLELSAWRTESVELLASEPGRFLARCRTSEQEQRFYRVRQLP